MKDEFDRWFTSYCLHKTASCLDRDILRWAKPILRIGFEMQEKDDEALIFKDSQKILDQLTQKDKQIELLLGCVEFYGKKEWGMRAREALDKYKEMTR